MDASAWFDPRDHFPQVLCEVEGADGKTIRGVYATGDWETPDGEWIRTPSRFRVIGFRIVTPLYSLDIEWERKEKNDEAQRSAE